MSHRVKMVETNHVVVYKDYETRTYRLFVRDGRGADDNTDLDNNELKELAQLLALAAVGCDAAWPPPMAGQVGEPGSWNDID